MTIHDKFRLGVGHTVNMPVMGGKVKVLATVPEPGVYVNKK